MEINLGALTSQCTCPYCHIPQELYPDDKVKVCKYCNKEFNVPTVNFGGSKVIEVMFAYVNECCLQRKEFKNYDELGEWLYNNYKSVNINRIN